MEGKKQLSTKSIILVGMFAAVLAVMSQVAIPMPSGVPMTLQTFAVALAGAVLGGSWAHYQRLFICFWVRRGFRYFQE